ncbi:hypothetical protein GCM10010151_18620 [Actinoallomurus spadix]|uniref:Uncharacterized protein n=1 Tax=Actinoallomurus spadix TaxID=79912 RepID=A0ABP3FX89_9ACTN
MQLSTAYSTQVAVSRVNPPVRSTSGDYPCRGTPEHSGYSAPAEITRRRRIAFASTAKVR